MRACQLVLGLSSYFRKFVDLGLPMDQLLFLPMIMEVENGVREDVFSLQMGYFPFPMIMGGRVTKNKFTGS